MQGYSVKVSNISNQGTDEEIQQYLTLVGPIKFIKITRQQRRAKVIYHDMQTASMAINYLGGTTFKARDLKIISDNYEDNKADKYLLDDQISNDLVNLSHEQRTKFAFIFSKFIKQQGQKINIFLSKHQKINDTLLNIVPRY